MSEHLDKRRSLGASHDSTTSMTEKELHFDVSTGLKSVLGSELITDDEVAIFELVKNSFDAKASLVELFFNESEIIVADNGVGMSGLDHRFVHPAR